MFVDKANHIYITMPMYNLIEYSNNYSDTPGTLWKFKRDEVLANNADLTINNSQSFKYKAALVEETANNSNGKNYVKDTKIVVPLEYLSNFWRSLEMPLINCKFHLELNWIKDCILFHCIPSAGNFAECEIINAALHVAIVTLSTKNSVNLTKQLSKGFKRSVYWNSYQTNPVKVIEKEKSCMNYLKRHLKRHLIHQGVIWYIKALENNKRQ